MDSSLQRSELFSNKSLVSVNSFLNDESSVGISSSSVPPNPSTWPVEMKKKEPSLVKFMAMDVIGFFKGCFSMKSKNEERDPDLCDQDMPGTSISTDRYFYQSCNSFASTTHSSYNETIERSGFYNFTMDDLRKATNNFSPSLQIGQGGFGIVYKGKLKNGRIIAVKRSKKSSYELQLSMEFISEVTTLSKVEHLNLVKMMGFLNEKNEQILVFEFISNGNLRQHLDGEFGSILALETRLDIAIDVARGLTYLHSYADQSFIHRDVKSTNVLLTDTLRAKVTDFGFSRLGPSRDVDATHVTTQIKGTVGYLDPEYIQTYQLTQKSDVYSFGVLLVEIISGRQPIEPRREINQRITLRWAYQMYIKGKAMDVLDPKLEHTPTANVVVEKILDLAFHCASPTKQDRPTMRESSEILWNIKRDIHNVLLHKQIS